MTSAATYRVYGIKNCNTMKKAMDWLAVHNIPSEFHDYKKSAIDAATLQRWCTQVGWQTLVNRRGQTWRKLTPKQQDMTDDAQAITVMMAHTSMIRRPVIEKAGKIVAIGFDEEKYREIFTTL